MAIPVMPVLLRLPPVLLLLTLTACGPAWRFGPGPTSAVLPYATPCGAVAPAPSGPIEAGA